jgi:hypothetical protein
MKHDHKIKWFVYAGETLIPRESTMRGEWAHEAKCSCGWESHTGGGTRTYVQRKVEDHKFDMRHGF